MIRITDIAQKHFEKLLSSQKQGTQIRIFIINPGTPDAECGASYCPPDTIKDTDVEFKFDKISAYVDKSSINYLQDAEIDFIIDKFGSQLTIKAPNAKICKVKENASLIDRIEYILQLQINPQLASHGGRVTLIEITNDMFAILQFGGGCNGCSMVNYTLKEGIEKELMEKFPELKGVRDITEHQHGEHSYY